ncbi:carboxypeptidase Y-deficient [Mycoemilia scoparia]|uniref:Carboxypeptidase Y-deficient n=1 Tax=Mycoemilia scoparia TaxID=417184 RepID=A0A9W7ZYU4_9FUNG|nr:carboxypeptidase Y-deficient [Mycoemilia scoparia]
MRPRASSSARSINLNPDSNINTKNTQAATTISSFACPICNVQAPNLFTLNQHLDEIHFGGAKDNTDGQQPPPPSSRTSISVGNASGGGGGRSRNSLPAQQDSFEDVSEALFGFFKKTGLRMPGLGISGANGGNSMDVSDDNSSGGGPQEQLPVGIGGRSRSSSTPPVASGGMDGALADKVTKAHWQPNQKRDRCSVPACAVLLDNRPREHCRNAANKSVLEGNRLEKRLEKLAALYVSFYNPSSSTVSLRKQNMHAAEQTVVAWQENSSADACPLCNRAFNKLTNRRHHCRLCGRVICSSEECLKSLPVPLPNTHGIYNSENIAHVRSCRDCERILLRQKERLHKDADPPEIARLYQILVDCKKQVESNLPLFHSIMYRLNASSGSLADSNIDIKRAKRTRKALMDAFNTMDLTSKQMLRLPAPTGSDFQLHKSIRLSVAKYLQTHMFPLSMLPQALNKSASGQGQGQGAAQNKPNAVPTVNASSFTPSSSQTSLEPISSTTSAAATKAAVDQGARNGQQQSSQKSPEEDERASTTTTTTVDAAGKGSQRRRVGPQAAASAPRRQPTMLQTLSNTVGGTVNGTLSNIMSIVTLGSNRPGSTPQKAGKVEISPESEARARALGPHERQGQLSVLREQREIVAGYIREATKSRRLDDVRTLNESLGDLDAEIYALEKYAEQPAASDLVF